MNKQRRNFIKAAAAGGFASTMGLPSSVLAQSINGVFSDYKALVCVFLAGGNDSWNTFVPTSSAEYNAYSASRGGVNSRGLAISQSDLLEVSGAVNGVNYGFHPSMSGLQSLYNSGDCAVIANVGPLVEPTSMQQFRNRSVGLPPQLFSHNDQAGQWHTLRGEDLSVSGWGGRIADVLGSQLGNQQLPTNISLAGTSLFQAGNVTIPYVMGVSGATSFEGLVPGETFSNTFQEIAASNFPNIYQRGFGEVQERAFQFSDLVTTTLANSRSFDALPDEGVESSLAIQLRTVAKIISQQSSLSMSRQIFFVQLGGFDTHDAQNFEQPLLLDQVSSSMTAFHQAMAEIGMQDSVTAYTASDFARTLTSNGDGSDHAWGGVHFAVGGSVQGGEVYGQYPSLELGSEGEIGRGRFIPTLSSDQYAATLASWFGVNNNNLGTVAPCINNFTQKDIGFMNV